MHCNSAWSDVDIFVGSDDVNVDCKSVSGQDSMLWNHSKRGSLGLLYVAVNW